MNANNQFTQIDFEDFQKIQYLDERKEIVKKNKILRTDAYNRTMDYIKWEKWDKIETFYLSLRKATNGVSNVIYWVKSIVDEVCRNSITQRELDFATDFYSYQTKKWWNGKFNPNRWQRIIDDNNWMLPIKVSWVDDWTVLNAWEPAIVVQWEAEIAAIFEPLFLRLFYKSAVASCAKIIDDIIWEGRVVEFGYRSAINDDMHMDAMESLVVGWNITRTSSDVTACALDLLADWTTAHRFFTAYATEDEAMIEAIEKNEKIALLVDSVESFAWIDKIMKLKKDYPNKIIAPRLDSWDLVAQTLYALNILKEQDMLTPAHKIVVADISTIDDIIKIENACIEAGFNPKDHIVYGLWGLLVARDKTRDAVSGGFKLSCTEDQATMKFSNDIKKQSIPWNPNVEIRDWERYIVQEDEEIEGLRLLKPLYDCWQFFYEKPKLSDMQKARKNMFETVKFAWWKTQFSQKTMALVEQIKERVGIN